MDTILQTRAKERMHGLDKDVLIHYLGQLHKMVAAVERFEQGEMRILTQQLAPDMLPFIDQVRTAADFALRSICPLADLPVVSFRTTDVSYVALRQQIEKTSAYLNGIAGDSFDADSDKPVKEKAGFAEVNLPRDAFLRSYALPNFFFHLCMAYAIARHNGVPLSKGDFDGFHRYPTDFSFV